MRLGIIDQRLKRGSCCFFEKIEREKIESGNNPFELIVARIPELENKTPERKRKYRAKAEKILKKENVDRIILSKPVKEACGISGSDERNRLFIEFVPNCIRRLAKSCGLKILESKVCIRDNNPGRITEYLLRELCFDTKRIEICSENRKQTEKIRDVFYEDTGLLITISENPEKSDAEIEIDVQKPSVRIGRDMVVDGIEFGFDLGGCDVDSLEVAATLKNVSVADRISSYLLGKKKLTLS